MNQSTLSCIEANKTIPNEPKNRKEIQIPEEYSKTIKENEFVLIDTKDAQRIIMFGTLDFFKKMCVTETLYGDGTFYSVPKLFYQLYTLHGFYKNEMIPFIYILLPDKKEQTYLRMFRLIQDKTIELNLTFSPKVFHLLKYEQEKFENKVLILNGGSSAKKQDAKYRKINNTIINLTNDYDNYTFASKLDFLHLISNCLTALK